MPGLQGSSTQRDAVAGFLTFDHLREERGQYSRIRLWGSIGFIVAVMLTGAMLDHVAPVGVLWACWGILLGILAVAMLLAEAPAQVHARYAQSIGEILRQPRVRALLLASFAMSAAHGVYYVFYSIYLKQLHYSATITGGLWALGVVAEIVLFVFMRQVLQRFPLKTILLCSIVLAIVRWLAIAWCAQYLWALLVAQLLHAMTFGATHITAIHFVHEYFGDQHQGKGQALYNSLGMGLGGMLGSLFSGYFWDLWGATGIFSIAALSCAIALLITSIWIGSDR